MCNKIKSIILSLFICVLPVTGSLCFAQNTVAVPYTSGFVGDNTGNNTCGNTVFMSSLGWTNFQFAQQTSGTVFVAQGNDVPGFVQITDYAGVEHTIQGSIKWRTTTGSTSTSVVFAPAITANAVLTTNTGNYTISSAKYIGMIFNGYSITINGGNVSGNAAGALDALNNYLVLLPDISVSDYTVNESAGTLSMVVTLSAASSLEIRVNYTSSNGSATAGLDYSSSSGTLIFAPNQTQKIVVFNIYTDLSAEPTENFFVTLSDPSNASILKTLSTVSITDNPPLPVELVFFDALYEEGNTILVWQTASEINTEKFVLEKRYQDSDWEFITELQAMGFSSEPIDYQYIVEGLRSEVCYFRLKQSDRDGNIVVFDPISVQFSPNENPFTIHLNQESKEVFIRVQGSGDHEGTIKVIESTGREMINQLIPKGEAIEIRITEQLVSGVYSVVLMREGKMKLQRFVW